MRSPFCIQARAATAAALAAAAVSTTAAPVTSPPHPPGEAAVRVPQQPASVEGGVTAVVVKSWSGCGSGSVVWQTLNDHWKDFGKVPIHIDYGNPALCAGPITYEALEASGAQAVILSDSAGGAQAFSQDEIDALTRYAEAGHNLIGTFLVLRFRDVDNRRLAPLFGLDPDRAYVRQRGVSPVFHMRPHSPLFEGVGQEYHTAGYLESQMLWHKKWTKAAVGEDVIEAHDLGHDAAILRYCGAAYRANLFTWMPEYGGGTQDQQVLYNAIAQARTPGCKAE